MLWEVYLADTESSLWELRAIPVSSNHFSHSVESNSLQPHGLHHTSLPCPLSTHGACSNSCPSSRWCHPIISSFVIPFSSCLQSFPASGSFLRSEFFASGGQSIEVSALVLPMNIQDWFLAGRKLEIWTLHHKQLTSAYNLNESGRGHWAPDETIGLTETSKRNQNSTIGMNH